MIKKKKVVFASILTFASLFGALLVKNPQQAKALFTGQTSIGFSIRNDGVFQKDGKSIFLMGFYHDSDDNSRYGEAMAGDVEKMGQAGFNVVQLIVTGPDGDKSSLAARQKAQQYGMYIIASYYAPSYENWLDHSKVDTTNTVMGWNTNDDINVPYASPNTDPDEALDKSNLIAKYATSIKYGTYTYGSAGGYPWKAGTKPHLLGAYKDVDDIMGVQSYPISNNDASFANAPMEENIAYLKYAKEQLSDSRPIIANLQSFAWDRTGARYPNAVETRNMVWASIVTKMDGIIAYSYWIRGNDLSTKTETWNEWVNLRDDIGAGNKFVSAGESERLMRAVLDGKYTYIDTTPGVFGKPRIHAATFEYTDPTNNKKYVYAVLVNTDSQVKEPKTPTTKLIKLPSSVATMTMAPLFPNDSRYGKTMTRVNDTTGYYLNGQMPPSDVQVYVFESGAAVATLTPTKTPTPSKTPTPTITPTSGPQDPNSLACLSDFNSDGTVNLPDYSILTQNFLKNPIPNPKTDINKDGVTDLSDYSLFSSVFLTDCL